MTTVKDVLKGKASEIWSVGPKDTVFYALTMMAEKEIGAVMVMDGNGRAVGIFSERDYARKVVLKGKSSQGNRSGRDHDACGGDVRGKAGRPRSRRQW